MKVAVVLAVLLVAVAAAPPEKRFIESISHLFHQAADALSHTFNQAKNSFNQLTSGLNINFDSVVQDLIGLIDSGTTEVNFDSVVQDLVGLIDSSTTESACKEACVDNASSFLGPAAPLAGTVCQPACKAALAKLEEAAGK